MRDADCNVDNIRIDILQNKGRSGAIGHIIAGRTGIIRAIQRNGRRRQPGVDEKNSSVCVAVLPALSVTMTVRVCFPSPISVGRIAPDAFDTLRRAYPVCAPINA